MGLSERLRAELSREPELAYAILFGSHSEGTARDDSDIDIAVKWRSKDAVTRLKLCAKLSGRLSLAYATTIDIIDVEKAPLDIAYSALTSGKPLIVNDKQQLLKDKIYYTIMYLDIAPVLRLHYEKMRERILAGKTTT
ncbi:MAG: nucleotidyltransferase domain-containing protein [Aigarchaeota archaeon]|nr:nucleotidyltransferase domain-containing protein [Candidatus Pelearchaeum maunauluense]